MDQQPGKYIVLRPNLPPQEFDDGPQAIAALVERPGYAKLLGPDGKLICTKGVMPEAS